MNAEMIDWLRKRPEAVQKLAQEFPIGCVLQPGKMPLYLVGYTETDHLIVSWLDPVQDWEAAQATKFYVCASHYRGSVILSRQLADA